MLLFFTFSCKHVWPWVTPVISLWTYWIHQQQGCLTLILSADLITAISSLWESAAYPISRHFLAEFGQGRAAGEKAKKKEKKEKTHADAIILFFFFFYRFSNKKYIHTETILQNNSKWRKSLPGNKICHKETKIEHRILSLCLSNKDSLKIGCLRRSLKNSERSHGK